ncbi:MAG: cupin domain-containing protein [Isosphaeraceae bacterium]
MPTFLTTLGLKRVRWSSVIPTTMALALGIGWASREAAFAQEQAEAVASKTVTLDQVKMSRFKDGEKPVGQIGIYLAGETPGSKDFVTGRFVIDPHQTPHAPHRHIEEEVMIVESGNGEILCDGKTTKVGPGSVMYTAPGVPHGITNTSDDSLTFTFIKWTSKGGK